jgi:integrase
MGTVYRRKGKKVLWIKYYRNGKPFYESSRSDKMVVAKRLLRKREGEISKGELPGIYFDKVRFDELAEDLLSDYLINGRKSLAKAQRSVKYLMEAFGGMRVTEITTSRIRTYIEERMTKKLSNASINRELAALKRMFHLGAICTPPKVRDLPYIPMLRENNVRKGFFEHEEYLALKNILPDNLKPIVTFGYHSGWRKNEILSLTWDKVDLKQGIARLDPGETKNNEARTFYMDEELLKEMRTLHSKRRLGCPYVFHRNGEPIKDFRWTWNSRCRQAGLKGRLFHDFRRSAVRNMIRAGVSEGVAMKISGHKTRSVFDRYNIVNDQDLKEATKKHEIYLKTKVKPSETSSERGVIIPLQHAQGTF